jgi:hypothetical protein
MPAFFTEPLEAKIVCIFANSCTDTRLDYDQR